MLTAGIFRKNCCYDCLRHLEEKKKDKNTVNKEADIKEKIRQIADHYGLKHQLQKLLEELGELIVAGAKDDNDENFVEEMADVSIMIEQAIYLLKKESQFAEIREKKIARQIKRIEEEKEMEEKSCDSCKYQDNWERKE